MQFYQKKIQIQNENENESVFPQLFVDAIKQCHMTPMRAVYEVYNHLFSCL